MRRYAGLLHYVLIGLFLGVSTVLLSGDFQVRLANSGGDDGPVAYALFVKAPEHFVSDAWLQNWQHIAGGTMQNWLPALLFKYLNVPPAFSAIALVFLQSILLGWAVFHLTMVLTGRREVGWLAVCFVAYAKPYVWNLACFGDLSWMPYAGHLALPFLIYAVACALEDRVLPMAAALLLGALFHPAVALYVMAMIGAYELWENRHENVLKAVGLRGGLMAAVAVLSLIPMQIAMRGAALIPADDMLPQTLINAHALPWMDPRYFRSMLRNAVHFVPFAALGALALQRKGAAPRIRAFWWTALAVCAGLCALHYLSVALRLGVVVRTIGTRSTLLVMILSVPPVMAACADRIGSRPRLAGWVIAGMLLLPRPAMMLAALLCLAAAEDVRLPRFLRLGPARRALLGSGVSVAVLMAIAALCPQIGAGSALRRYFFLGRARYRTQVAFVITTLCAAERMWAIESRERLRQWLKRPLQFRAIPTSAAVIYAVCAVMASLALADSRTVGRRAVTDMTRAYLDAQRWAREETPTTASFILVNASPSHSWRSYAHRPLVSAYCTQHYYVCTMRAKAYDDRLRAFYSRYGTVTDEMMLRNDLTRLILMLDEHGWTEFAQEFGGDYLVWRTDEASFKFPVAYSNDHFTVYKIPQAGGAGGQ